MQYQLEQGKQTNCGWHISIIYIIVMFVNRKQLNAIKLNTLVSTLQYVDTFYVLKYITPHWSCKCIFSLKDGPTSFITGPQIYFV